jgi:hypothetical protein
MKEALILSAFAAFLKLFNSDTLLPIQVNNTLRLLPDFEEAVIRVPLPAETKPVLDVFV